MNLLTNAIKFTNEGSITLSVDSKDNQTFVIKCKDTGTGIKKSLLKKLN